MKNHEPRQPCPSTPTEAPVSTESLERLSERGSQILETVRPFLLAGYSEAETAERLQITKPQLEGLLAELRTELATRR